MQVGQHASMLGLAIIPHPRMQVLMQTNRDSHALIRRKPPPADAHARDEIFQVRMHAWLFLR